MSRRESRTADRVRWNRLVRTRGRTSVCMACALVRSSSPPPSVQVVAATGTTSLPAAFKGARREESEADEGTLPGALRARTPCPRLRGAGGGAETGDRRQETGGASLCSSPPGLGDASRTVLGSDSPPPGRRGQFAEVWRETAERLASPSRQSSPRAAAAHSQQSLTPRPSFVFRDGGPGMTVCNLPPRPPGNCRGFLRKPLGPRVSELDGQREDFPCQRGNQLGGRESHLSPALGQRLLGALAPAVAHTCLSLPVGLTLQPLQIHLGLANPEGRGGGAEQEKDTGEKGKTEAQ